MTDPAPTAPAEPASPASPESPLSPASPVSPASPASAAPAPDPARDGRVVLVRRRRVPALGFWVLLAVLVSAVIGAGIAWFAGVHHLTGILYFAVTAIFLIGGPLALVAAIVDAILDRRRRRP